MFIIICCASGPKCKRLRNPPLNVRNAPEALVPRILHRNVVSKGLRQFIFWTHLVIGIAAGLVIAVMCFTGVALAFEKEIVAWSDRDLRRVKPVAAPSMTVEEAFSKVSKTGSLAISTDPNTAILVSSGRTNAVYLNQYTGAVTAPASPVLRSFLNTMIEWHRFLAQSGDARPRGKMITGACNFAFLFLATSGVYLWWPRSWNFPALRNSLVLNLRASGKARDWNWHNAVGFWTAPVLIVLTATALPISYKWAGDGIYKFTGTQAPPPPQQQKSDSSSRSTSPTIASIIETVRKEIPTAAQITIRSGARGPLTLTVKEQNPRPRFANIQLTIDTATGAITKKETYADGNAGRKVRSWTRFLHTGEALGPIGQTIAGLASLGGLFLVWTGFALAIRRLFGKKPKIAAPARKEESLAEVSA